MSTDATIEKQLGGLSRSGKVPKQAKVKNKAPAELQITAEQLLREAKERELEIVPPPPKQKVFYAILVTNVTPASDPNLLMFTKNCLFFNRSKMRMSWQIIRCVKGKDSRIRSVRTGP